LSTLWISLWTSLLRFVFWLFLLIICHFSFGRIILFTFQKGDCISLGIWIGKHRIVFIAVGTSLFLSFFWFNLTTAGAVWAWVLRKSDWVTLSFLTLLWLALLSLLRIGASTIAAFIVTFWSNTATLVCLFYWWWLFPLCLVLLNWSIFCQQFELKNIQDYVLIGCIITILKIGRLRYTFS
jgi:hypothetical protein